MTCHDPNYCSCPGPRLTYQQSYVLFSKPCLGISHLEFFVCKTKLTTPVLYLSVLLLVATQWGKLVSVSFKWIALKLKQTTERFLNLLFIATNRNFVSTQCFPWRLQNTTSEKAQVLRSLFAMMTKITLQFPCASCSPTTICCLLAYNQTVNSSRFIFLCFLQHLAQQDPKDLKYFSNTATNNEIFGV